MFSSAGTYPLPLSMFMSILSLALSSKVAITKSLFKTSTSGGQIISAPVTVHGPWAWILRVLLPSPSIVAESSFKVNIISVTSSLTPGTVENSWRTPSILIEFTATPGREDNNILLRAFPIVIPYPLSKGSMTNFPYL